MITVYGMSTSGNCHKVRLVLDHLARPYTWREISTIDGETRTPDFLARNPNGKVPLVRLDNGHYLWESGAILHYLANGTPLWPDDRLAQAEVLKWMFFEQNIHEIAVAEARFIKRFLAADHPRQAELPLKHQKGHAALAVMEKHLQTSPFLVADQCSIADIALFAYTHVAEEGGFEMSGYKAIERWIATLLDQPGFTRMPA